MREKGGKKVENSGKLREKGGKFFLIFDFFSTFSMLFSLFYCDSFGFIRGKTQKIEKSNLFISFSLYFQCSNFFLAVRKYFKNGSLGTKNGPSDPLKFLVSLEISKLGPVAHY